MSNPDSAAARHARASAPGQPEIAGITDPYIRRQLEVRRAQIQTAMSEAPAGQAVEKAPPFTELLYEVDSAIQRMDAGTYGICEACHDSIEKERLIADPLTTLCLDHLTGEEQRALERDLELAARIQRGLLPPEDTAVGDWRIYFRYKPAGIVSGDYCDVIAGAGHESGPLFLVGDVAGKGVAAALLMSHLHALFRSLSGTGLELGQLLETANRVFCESTLAGQYATLICGRANDSGQIEVASAGHLPALLVSKGGVQKIGSTGLPLGMFAASRYAVNRVNVEPGESLLLFTDGLSEASSASGQEYGIEGLSAAAANSHRLPPTELAAACFKNIEAFGSGIRQADDQTLMVVRRAVH
jgi:phosphoserine phosphatase RsbU/P